MKKKLTTGFWEFIAGIILRNRIVISVGIVLLTIFLAMQWKNVGMTYNEANLLPQNHKANKDYTQFLNTFGEEGNLIVIGVKDNKFFTPKAYKAWNELMTNLKSHKEVELVVSLNDLKKLQKNDTLERFELVPLIDQKKTLDPAYLAEIKRQLFNI
jgi:predicted RND superfamily exporter protein